MTLLRHQSTHTPAMKGVLQTSNRQPSMRIRARRFLTDRYAYRERPDYLIELVAFGIIVITAILSLANAIATLK
jgi:hypothetical protein